jgi:hypothetical protein
VRTLRYDPRPALPKFLVVELFNRARTFCLTWLVGRGFSYSLSLPYQTSADYLAPPTWPIVSDGRLWLSKAESRPTVCRSYQGRFWGIERREKPYVGRRVTGTERVYRIGPLRISFS